MQDDPERVECFQHKMPLKPRQPGAGAPRGMRVAMRHAERLALAEMRECAASSGSRTFVAERKEVVMSLRRALAVRWWESRVCHDGFPVKPDPAQRRD